jgi:hypothetical protein
MIRSVTKSTEQNSQTTNQDAWHADRQQVRTCSQQDFVQKLTDRTSQLSALATAVGHTLHQASEVSILLTSYCVSM